MKKFISLFCLLIFLVAHTGLIGQEPFPRNDVRDQRDEAIAFTNAVVYTHSTLIIEEATLLIKNGKIVDVGKDLKVPQGYKSVDLEGKFVYPSFIDLHSNYGLPKVERARGGFGGAEQIMSKTPGAYNANEAIKSHYNASSEFDINEKSADEMRQQGFGAVLTHRPDGLSRGTSAMVTLGAKSDNTVMLKQQAGAHYSLNKGTSQQNYPGSMMGYIALLRQTFLDAEWYSSQTPRPFSDQTLEAWLSSQSLPQFFDAGNWLNVLRADKIGDEFKTQFIIVGGGDEYKRLKEIRATNAFLIVPVDFPDAYDVEDPMDADKVSFADMKHWELAPANLGFIEKNNIPFAITSSGTQKNEFLNNLRSATEHGLSKESALKSLTETPAKILNMAHRIGSIQKGKEANFFIASGDIFEKDTEILENWIQGDPFRFKSMNPSDFSGQYTLTAEGQNYELVVEGEPGKEKSRIVINDSTDVDVSAKFSTDLITMNFSPDSKAGNSYRLSGWTLNEGWMGKGQDMNGNWFDWTAIRKPAEPKGEKSDSGTAESDGKKQEGEKPEKLKILGEIIYPFVAFGRTQLPVVETMIVTNATVWTNEKEGILMNTDVLLKGGKISKIGKNLREPNARIIDGTGKHLTSGIIDEHTHVGGGGNDRATNSSMVRIGDQLNPEQINIYRTLAGGVTTAQVLHGSANPIGGQSALIKFRWGESPENMKIKGADEYIKFALGENVKRSRSTSSIRYPQSRMGVEQVYVDAFTNAREYEKEWKTYNGLNPEAKLKAVKPRRDLVNEAILEILNGERFITCHSYVQSEINMLMKVAEQFDFRINTFTHIMEGYKVADKMREHGVGASTFSDWWNYKWEVRYAIPYNAAIMHNEGVLTAINSDDSNMGRRLNQEAAKTIKYGGLSEEDAWKLVTLNPAKLLHLDDRMGSVKVGKDADVVIWSDHPLSVYAKAEKTIIDGKVYFDIDEDQKARTEMEQERIRIIQKMKGERKVERECKDQIQLFSLNSTAKKIIQKLLATIN